MRPNRAIAASSAAAGAAGSARSSGATSVSTPNASASRAVCSSVPGSGLVAERRIVEECSSRSAPVTVRAVTATSNPRRASSSAQARPMPRLAPVMNATFRSAIVVLLAPGPQLLDVAPRDAPAVGAAHQLVVIAHADGATAAGRQPVLGGAVRDAGCGIAGDLEAVGGDRMSRRGVALHGGGQGGQRVGDRAAGQRAVVAGVGREAGCDGGQVAGVHTAGVAQEQLADGGAIVDLLLGHGAPLRAAAAWASSKVRPMTKRRLR